MATRFYLGSLDGAPSGITPAYDASWSNTASAVRRRMTTSKRGSTMTPLSVAETSATSPYDVLIAQYISEPLRGIALSGFVKGIIQAMEGVASAAGDMRAQMLVKAVSESGATARGTLLALDATPLSNEFDASSLINRKFPVNYSGSGGALTPLTLLDNDRLVIEVGYRAYNSVTTSYTGTLQFGDSNASDLGENEIGAAWLSPWFEFDATLVFANATDRRADKEPLHDQLSLQSTRVADNSGSYAPITGVAGYVTASLAAKIAGIGSTPDSRSLPATVGAAGPTTYYLMGWKDPDCGPLTYRTWTVTGSPDPTGLLYAGAKCGATAISGAVVLARWQA